MNCDQVFDILTRGPFPTGTACDPPVEAHLNQCAECRRLAEALRPAVELFQEAINPEESRDLPGYWCAVAAQRQPAVSFAERLEPRRRDPNAWKRSLVARHWTALALWRMVAMLALGVTLGTMVSSRLDGFNMDPPFGAAAGVVPADDQPDVGAAQLSTLAVLPAACKRNQPDAGPRYTVRGDQLLAQADLKGLICCSECHHSGSDSVPSAATQTVAQSCQVCHREQPAFRPARMP